MNVFLTGFMGSGKSTVGPQLARMLEYAFVDTDAEIERAAGKPTAEIFAQQGEGAFRILETLTLEKICQGTSQVVALGGGSLLNPGNQTLVRSAGTLVSLEAQPQTLLGRLTVAQLSRPLLATPTKSDAELKARIEVLLKERKATYANVALTVPTDSKTPEQVADEIARWLGMGGF